MRYLVISAQLHARRVTKISLLRPTILLVSFVELLIVWWAVII